MQKENENFKWLSNCSSLLINESDNKVGFHDLLEGFSSKYFDEDGKKKFYSYDKEWKCKKNNKNFMRKVLVLVHDQLESNEFLKFWFKHVVAKFNNDEDSNLSKNFINSINIHYLSLNFDTN